MVCAQAGPGSLSSWSPPPSRRRHPPPPSPPGRSLRACGAEGLGPRAAPRRPPHACLSAFEVTFINPCLERELLFLVCPDGRLQGQARSKEAAALPALGVAESCCAAWAVRLTFARAPQPCGSLPHGSLAGLCPWPPRVTVEGEEGATRLWQWTGGRVWGRECAGARVRAAVATARGSGSGGQRAWVCVGGAGFRVAWSLGRERH